MDHAPRRTAPERVLALALAVAVADCAYLSWRYLALHAEFVTPGTGLCSWTRYVDCDQVLLTPQARAFYTPNALLGLGFFLGCLFFERRTRALEPAARTFALQLLAGALGVATLFTFWFWWLLLHLQHLCPFCPWNHAFTWLGLGAAVVALRSRRGTPGPDPQGRSRVLRLAALCALQGLPWQLLWFTAYLLGRLTP